MIVHVNTPNKGTVNMRVAPEKDARILTQIPYQTKLDAIVVDSNWMQVSYDNQTGYVMSKFLSSNSILQEIYDSLKTTLALIEKALK